MKEATATDVANLAGVSQATVSRVINGSNRVSDETKLLVNDAIKKLKYKTNVSARNLISGKTNLVGIIVPDGSYPYSYNIIHGLSNKLKKYGYSSIIIPWEKTIDETLSIENLTDYRVDGIISFSDSFNDKNTYEMNESRTPFIQIGRVKNEENSTYIIGDNYDVGRKSAKHFISTGEKHLVYVNGDIQSYTGCQRKQGFFDEANKYDDVTVKELSLSFDYHLAHNALSLLDLERGGYLCATDVLAYALIDTVKKSGQFNIPSDLQIIGADGLEMSSWESYDLSLFTQNYESYIDSAIDILRDSLEDFKIFKKVVELDFKKRGSTK